MTGGGAKAGGGTADSGGRSSGGVKPRLGKLSAARFARRMKPPVCAGAATTSATSDAVASPSGAAVPRLNVLVKKREGRLALASVPMRSGMASVAKPTNESAPATRAAQGAQRQLSSFGSPWSRIQAKTNALRCAWPATKG